MEYLPCCNAGLRAVNDAGKTEKKNKCINKLV